MDDGSIQWPVGVTAFATTVGTPDVLSVVTPTVGLPVRLADGSGYITTLAVSLASVPSHAVTNAGVFAVQVDGAALTALQLIDDPVFADDAAFTPGTSKVMMFGAQFDDTAPDSVDEGDAGAVRMSANRNMFVTLRDAAGNERGLNIDGSGNLTANITGTVTVGSHAVTNAGTFAVQAAQSGTWTVTGTGGTFPVTDSGGSLTVDAPVGTPVFVRLSDGSAAITTLPVSLASVPSHAVTNAGTFAVQVDNTVTVASHAVTNTGTFAVQVDGAALTALQLIDNLVLAEDAVHGSGDPGVQMLAVRRDTAASSTVTDGDYGSLNTDSTGRLWCNVSNTVTVASHAVTNVGTFAVQAAQSGTWNIDTVTTVSAVTAITNALPAGTNNIGDVDVLSIIPGTGATNLGKAVDTATGATDTGVLVLATRDDALSALTPVEGDNVQLRTDANGALWVIPSGTITVASHAVTNAGTFAVQVDGSALTALQLIDDVVFAEDVAAQAADKGIAILAVRRDADTTLVGTDNDYANLQVDANGYLKVEVFDGGGSHTVDNAGTFAVQVDGSALTALQLIDNTILVDDAAFTPATSSVSMVGFQADETATDSVDEGDAGAARMTLDRKVIVTPQPHTAGGLSIFRSLDLDETEEDVKTSAGQVYGGFITNLATSTRYVKFYNLTAANTTVGSSTPVITLAIPGNATDDIGATFNAGGMGIAFDTAICVAATTGFADADTGAPGANEVIVNLWYK